MASRLKTKLLKIEHVSAKQLNVIYLYYKNLLPLVVLLQISVIKLAHFTYLPVVQVEPCLLSAPGV